MIYQGKLNVEKKIKNREENKDKRIANKIWIKRVKKLNDNKKRNEIIKKNKYRIEIKKIKEKNKFFSANIKGFMDCLEKIILKKYSKKIFFLILNYFALKK